MSLDSNQLDVIKDRIKSLALKHGFQDLRVSDTDTSKYFEQFQSWVSDGFHGDMSYLERNHNLRKFPDELHEDTCRILSLRYDYLPTSANFSKTLENPKLANISRYALGRDYHKLIRKKLNLVINALKTELPKLINFQHRVFVDSAPVLETAFAEKSGLGWKGKHSLIINKDAGSWFFLGEVFINLPLTVDTSVQDQCGSCNACVSLCPTDAILDGKKIDARKCISYLTIENNNSIPENLRTLIGNRIYGCDDCQLVCPWNRYASLTSELGFQEKNDLTQQPLKLLWRWTEEEFLQRFEGSPIRRIGFQNWLRNLAVAIGNSGDHSLIIELEDKKPLANKMVLEHIDWAIDRLNKLKKTQAKRVNKKLNKLIKTINVMLPRDA